MNQREYVLKVIETIAAVIGVVGGLGGALWGYLDYREKAELQALRGLHDAQMATCNEVAASTAHLLSATSAPDFDTAVEKFGEVKHGKALLLLDKGTLDQMVLLWNKAVDLSPAPQNQDDFQDAIVNALGNAPFDVVLSCRRMLAHGLETEGKKQIDEISNAYVMSWSAAPTATKKR